jgi:cysteine synthase A
MSVERRKILEYFGARVVLTPGEGGMQGAVDKARELAERTPGAFMPSQFTNPSNPGVHQKTTAVEIWEDTGGEVDGVVAGIGTGGTLSGIARELKSRKPTLLAVGVEPESSQVLSGKPPGKHGIQGIGAGFIPKVLDRDLLDRVVAVSDREAIRAARLLASREGIFCGISSGAAFHGALEIAGEAENAGKTLVVILPDSGERYLSTPLFETQ